MPLALGAEKFHLFQGVDWLLLNKVTAANKQMLLKFDDVCRDDCRSKESPNLAFCGRHQKLFLLVLKHNLYQQSPYSKTKDLSISEMLLLRNRRETNHVDCLGRQLGCRELSVYKRATQEQFVYVLIDLDPPLIEHLRLSSNILSKPAVFFCNSSEKVMPMNSI